MTRTLGPEFANYVHLQSRTRRLLKLQDTVHKLPIFSCGSDPARKGGRLAAMMTIVGPTEELSCMADLATVPALHK